MRSNDNGTNMKDEQGTQRMDHILIQLFWHARASKQDCKAGIRDFRRENEVGPVTHDCQSSQNTPKERMGTGIQ